jgi:hypothetical protein
MPYGIKIKNNEYLTCFNREYSPLGYCTEDRKETNFVYTQYNASSIKRIVKKFTEFEDCSFREEINELTVWLYSDKTNPVNTLETSKNKKLWNNYWKKVELLSKLKIKKI